MKNSKKAINLVFLTILSFFFVNFVAQKKDSTNLSGYGELGGINKVSTATSTTGGSVFQPTDRAYMNENTPHRRFIPYAYLRQADVAWEKRVWRRIDLREKINEPLMFPTTPTQNRMAFVDMIKKGLKDETIFLYSDDEFTARISDTAVINKKFYIEKKQMLKDMNGDDSAEVNIKDVILTTDIFMVDLKEDWFFDRQRSVLDVRVLGIGLSCIIEKAGAPVEVSIGWIYYPQCRPIFANNEIYNLKNDAERRTYEDFFWKRLFNSYITRETNVFERDVSQYTKGLDALIEADRIKGDMFRWEHDLWHF
jgi:gliding motility associated protien GldN